MDENVNGLMPEEIEQELNLLVNAKIDEIPGGASSAVSDAIYDAIQGDIPMLAQGLTQVGTIDQAEEFVREHLSETIEETAMMVDKNINVMKIHEYIEKLVGEIGGIMQTLGFNINNVEDI